MAAVPPLAHVHWLIEHVMPASPAMLTLPKSAHMLSPTVSASTDEAFVATNVACTTFGTPLPPVVAVVITAPPSVATTSCLSALLDASKLRRYVWPTARPLTVCWMPAGVASQLGDETTLQSSCELKSPFCTRLTRPACAVKW
jgi:hypothetical protein